MKCCEKSWCPSMNTALHIEANARARGLVAIRVLNGATGKQRIIGVAWKNDAKDRGTMLNVCPWCEARLDAQFAENGATTR